METVIKITFLVIRGRRFYRIFFTVLLLFLTVNILAQDITKYHGGSYDGFSLNDISQTGLGGTSANLAKYYGGSFDGFSLNDISQTGLGGSTSNLAKYYGGSYDGFSLNDISQTGLGGSTSNLAKYYGGSYDGFSLNDIFQTGLGGSTSNLAKYYGGSYDGFSLNDILNSGLGGSASNLAKYFGGSYDGFVLADINSVSLGGSGLNLAKYIGGSYDGFAFAHYYETPLPLNLSSFLHTVKQNNVLLKWSTEKEKNNSGFDIERKPEGGQEWMKLGFIQSKGFSNEKQDYSYEDIKLKSGKYNYRLKQFDLNGNFAYFNLGNTVEVGIPKKYELSQNYPNPFNQLTVINYQIPIKDHVSIKVYDLLGKEILTIVNEELQPGYYEARFDAKDLSSGVYFYRLESENFTSIKKLILLK
jgi:hypothetical protein